MFKFVVTAAVGTCLVGAAASLVAWLALGSVPPSWQTEHRRRATVAKAPSHPAQSPDGRTTLDAGSSGASASAGRGEWDLNEAQLDTALSSGAPQPGTDPALDEFFAELERATEVSNG